MILEEILSHNKLVYSRMGSFNCLITLMCNFAKKCRGKRNPPTKFNKVLHFFIRTPLCGRSGDCTLLSLRSGRFVRKEVKRVQS